MIKIFYYAILALFFLVLFMVIINLFPGYKYTYFEAPDKRHMVTRIDYDGKTYFTCGKYESKSIPDNYISPDYSGINSGFELFLFFEKDSAILYAQNGTFTTVGKNSRLKSQVFKGYGNDPVFHNMRNDNTGKYHFLTD